VALMEKTADDSPHAARTPQVDQDAGESRRLDHDDPVLVEIRRRFGLAADCFAPLAVMRKNRREIVAVAGDHRPPRFEKPAMGLPFIRVGNRYPKLTTAATMFLARQVTRNRIDLTTGQMESYLARRRFRTRPDQIDGLTGGYIMVAFRGYALGLGCLHTATGEIESLYPKDMAVDAEHLIT
jgi:NOL1/NOP2/fmu family ribosome biogenesis protein